MTLTIDLTPSEEAQLSAAAKQTGLAPSDLVKKIVRDYLPAALTTEEDSLDARLRAWQAEDGTQLQPDVSTQTLFAQWAEQDAVMTDDEREAEDLLWKDIEKGLSEHSNVLHLRRLGE